MSLLVSFFYLKDWMQMQHAARPAKLMLDSGAYSAWNAGKQIDIQALTEESKNPVWDEAISLDVVGDPETTWANTLWQLKQGAPVYPVFHIGEPWDYLQRYCEKFDKVGLSCRFGEPLKESMRWLEQCFARAWPHKFHSFGWVGKMLKHFPFHSADSASWEQWPLRWGRWKSYGPKSNFDGPVVKGLRVPGEHPVMIGEMQAYWDLQQRLKQQWGKELSRL